MHHCFASVQSEKGGFLMIKKWIARLTTVLVFAVSTVLTVTSTPNLAYASRPSAYYYAGPVTYKRVSDRCSQTGWGTLSWQGSFWRCTGIYGQQDQIATLTCREVYGGPYVANDAIFAGTQYNSTGNAADCIVYY